MLIFLLALAVVAGGAFAQDDNGSWSFEGKAQVNGSINLPTTSADNSRGEWTDNTGNRIIGPNTATIKGYGDIDGELKAVFSKTDKFGADFTASLGFAVHKSDLKRVSLELGWDRTLGAGKLNTKVLMSNNDGSDTYPADDAPDNWSYWTQEFQRIDLRAGYSEDSFGVNLGLRTHWDQLLGPFLPGYTAGDPHGTKGSGRSQTAPNSPSFRGAIFATTHLNGWVKTLDNQLKMDFRYREGDATDVRVSDLISRNWLGGDESIGLTFTPNAVDGLTTALTLKIQGDNYDKTQGGAASQSLTFVMGAKYALNSDMSFHIQYANGFTSGDLWANEDDRKAFMTENNYYPNYVPLAKSNRRGGLNAGFKMALGDLSLNADVQIIGMSRIEYYGVLGFGIKAAYSAAGFGADLTFKFYNTLWDAEKIYGGSKDDNLGYIVLPVNVSYAVIPDTVTAKLGITLDQGLAGGIYASSKENGEGFDMARSTLKVNPKIEWNVNSNANTKLTLGYSIKFDLASPLGSKVDGFNQHDDLAEHNITLGFNFSF